jgi:capsule polysaccharide export protein KpsE/RkpR
MYNYSERSAEMTDENKMLEEVYTRQELEEHMDESYLRGYQAGVKAERERYKKLLQRALALNLDAAQKLERLRVGGHEEVC